MVDRLVSWLEIDSTTGREAAFLRQLEEDLEHLGLSIRRQPVPDDEGRDRWNLIALASEAPSCLFSTHVDTVPPHLPVRSTDDAVYGRGACDTKGGLLGMYRAARRLLETGIDDFGFLLVVGEEVDHRGAKCARSLELAPDRIILCEPTRNRIVSGQKGMVKVDADASGRAAHSAFPSEGSSAIHAMIDSLAEIRSHNWPSDELLGETTVNIGTVDGGVAANVLAPRATAEIVLRTVSASEPLIERLRELCAPAVEIEPVTYNDPVEFDPPDDLPTTVVPFNTDAPYLSALAPVWLVGPGDIRVAHSEDEHITRRALREGADRFEQLARRVVETSDG